jgi:hypothetical protein
VLEGERIISVRFIGSRIVRLLSTIALACYHGRRAHLPVSREQESGHMKLYLSDYFEVSEEALDQYGAFNISLVSDLSLFIDPFLLFNIDKPEYRRLHDRIIDYLRFLRDKSVGHKALSFCRDVGFIRD